MTDSNQPKNSRNPWAWIPSLYFYQGIPYSIVMITSGLIYKTMGVSIATFAFWTSLLYLPWAIKPLWSPYIDVVSTKRNWILWTQLLLGAAFIAVGFAMQLPFYSNRAEVSIWFYKFKGSSSMFTLLAQNFS